MITILKKGRIKEFVHVCSDCGCEYTYDATDIQQMDLSEDKYVNCPFCGSANDIKGDKEHEGK